MAVMFVSLPATVQASRSTPLTRAKCPPQTPTSSIKSSNFILGSRSRFTKNMTTTTAKSQRTNKHPSVTAISMSTVLVAGASQGLGLEILNELDSLVKRDPQTYTYSIHAISKDNSPRWKNLPSLQSTHVLDARDRSALMAIVKQIKPDVVISCIGGAATDPMRPDYSANTHLIDAAKEVGAKRFVLISALGSGESETSVPFQVMDTMRDMLLDKSRAEKYLKNSGLVYTILRPGPLVDGEKQNTGCITESLKGYGTITRKDLASIIAKVLDSEKTVNKVFTAVDRTKVLLTSPYVRPLEFWEPLPFEEFAI